MSEPPAEPRAASGDGSAVPANADTPQFRYVEDFVRYQLGKSLGGARGMIESALPFIAFTVVWVVVRQLYPAIGAAVVTAFVLALIRLIQRQSIKYVVQAVIPTAIAVLIAMRTGRAQDIFLPGILYNGVLAALSLVTVAIGKPLVGFVIGAAVGDPTGWTKDRGLVKMTSKLTLVLAVPYLTRFLIQLPLFLGGQVILLGIAKVVLGWPMLIAALAVIGLMLSKGQTPIEDSALANSGSSDISPQNESPTQKPRFT
jgi:hypothetical protein